MKRIENFVSNNDCVKAENHEGRLIVNNCWNDSSFRFEFSDTEVLDFLEMIVLPQELFAIYHKDKNMYEFIFLPLQKKYEREFEYIYCDKKFRLYYGKPTQVFENLTNHFVINETADEINERAYGFLRYYQYYTSQNTDNPEPLIPTNFFIEGDFVNLPYEKHFEFFRHVNFMLSYYDRKSPNILIYNDSKDSISDIKIPCKSNTESFPKTINSNNYDTTLLELMEAAKGSGSYRLKYIFYFQVLEYCSYYYIENNLRRKITNIIKSPDILNSEKYSRKIIEIYSDYFKSNKDDKRMERLLLDLCPYEDIKDELKTNSKFFIDDLCFDGGFYVKGLFKDENEIDSPPQTIIQTIRKNIDSIRNVLVHARESRENSEIKATQKNIQLLTPYLFLLRRIAETVIIKYE